jgi:hypothetical protein
MIAISLQMLKPPKCPTCNMAVCMRRQVNSPARVRCSYFQFWMDNTTLACLGYDRAKKSVIKRRIKRLQEDGGYDERDKKVIQL